MSVARHNRPFDEWKTRVICDAPASLHYDIAEDEWFVVEHREGRRG
jgi:hypothetical protein